MLAQPDLFEVSTGPPVKWLKETALSRLMWKNVGVMNGEHHRDQRRLMLPAFHKQQVGRYCDEMVRLAQAALERWQEQSEIDILPEMRQLTLRIGVQTLLGLHDEAELERVGVLMRALVSSLPWLAVPINVPGMPYHRVLRLAEQLEARLRSFIMDKRAQPDAPDVLAALIQAHDEDGKKQSLDELVGNVFGLFAAGYKTTAHALTWTLFLLDRHPLVLAMLLQRYRLAVIPGARITPSFTMSPVYGMPMRVFPQDRQFERSPVRGTIHRLIDQAP